MSIDNLPVCDHGRCSAILDAIAKRDDRISASMSAVIAAAIEAVLTEHGVDHTSTSVRASLGRHLSRLAGPDVASGSVK